MAHPQQNILPLPKALARNFSWEASFHFEDVYEDHPQFDQLGKNVNKARKEKNATAFWRAMIDYIDAMADLAAEAEDPRYHRRLVCEGWVDLADIVWTALEAAPTNFPQRSFYRLECKGLYTDAIDAGRVSGGDINYINSDDSSVFLNSLARAYERCAIVAQENPANPDEGQSYVTNNCLYAFRHYTKRVDRNRVKQLLIDSLNLDDSNYNLHSEEEEDEDVESSEDAEDFDDNHDEDPCVAQHTRKRKQLYVAAESPTSSAEPVTLQKKWRGNYFNVVVNPSPQSLPSSSTTPARQSSISTQRSDACLSTQ